VLHGPDGVIAGAGHPGVPGIWFGTNGRTAWGITNNAASTRDLYVEHVHPDDPTLYRDQGTWLPFQERTVSIPVRGEAPRTFALRSTVRGPIVNNFLPSVDPNGDPPLSLRWVGHEHLDDVQALLGINRAHDWPAFREALSGWSVPIFNFGYADATGRVAYQCAGRVPIRGRVTRGYRDSSNREDGWQGYVPFESLPRIEDPPRGYVATANNRVAPDDFPYPLHGAWASGHRAIRLRQALDTTSALTRDDMIALQTDVRSCRAQRLVPPLVAHLRHSQDRDVALLRDALAAWDYRYTQASAAPTLFEAFMQGWQARVAAERFPAHLLPLATPHGSAAAQLLEDGPDSLPWFAGGATAFTAALHECALHAVARLRVEHGDDLPHWTWGAVHLAHWLHPLGRSGAPDPTRAAGFHVGPAAVDGGADTVCNTGAGPRFESNGGAEYRLLVDFSAPDRIWAIQNAGNSGVPTSPHYADQFPDWLAGRYHTIPLDRAGVENDLESRLTLSSSS
jgi:penicillin amidase